MKFTSAVLRVLTLVACADVLAGRKTVGTIKGTVVYAGHKASRSFLRRYTGYVEQFGTTQSLLALHHLPELESMRCSLDSPCKLA